MSRRHTLTSPEQRRMPISGRYRLAVRLQVVDKVIDDETGELAYAEIKDGEGNIIQPRANRRTRRAVAWGTRLHADGHPWQTPPMSRRARAAEKRTVEVEPIEEISDDDWLEVVGSAEDILGQIGAKSAGFAKDQKVRISK